MVSLSLNLLVARKWAREVQLSSYFIHSGGSVTMTSIIPIYREYTVDYVRVI